MKQFLDLPLLFVKFMLQLKLITMNICMLMLNIHISEEVRKLTSNNQLERIKAGIKKNVGNRVKLTFKSGRKSKTIKRGVIESIYPSIFVVKLDSDGEVDNSNIRASYSYTDILTKNIELALCKANSVQAARH